MLNLTPIQVGDLIFAIALRCEELESRKANGDYYSQNELDNLNQVFAKLHTLPRI
jgi:hypothetical protein